MLLTRPRHSPTPKIIVLIGAAALAGVLLLSAGRPSPSAQLASVDSCSVAYVTGSAIDVLYTADYYGATDALGMRGTVDVVNTALYAYDVAGEAIEATEVASSCTAGGLQCGLVSAAYFAADGAPPQVEETINLLHKPTSTVYTRTFSLDLPAKFDTCDVDTRYPILVDFHGYQFNHISQRYWSRWASYQRKVKGDFILVTPDGSGDAVSGPGFPLDTKGWNVLGAGDPSKPSAAGGSCDGTCFDWHWEYVCYRTQRGQDPSACSGNVSSTCATMSAQNDVAFVEAMLQLVATKYQGDVSRIYFTGQSMGGLATLHMARHMPEKLKPAAIVTSSAAAMRSSTVQLHGRIPALMFHGVHDTIIPPQPWLGGHTKEGKPADDIFPLTANKTLAELIRFDPGPLGGKASKLGCPNKWNETTSVSEDGWMYDPLPRTVQGVAGKPVDLFTLDWAKPAGKSDGVVCADVDGTAAPVKVCAFDGGHCLPWQNEACLWKLMGVADDHAGEEYHDFVWKEFLRGGLRRRGGHTHTAQDEVMPVPSPGVEPALVSILLNHSVYGSYDDELDLAGSVSSVYGAYTYAVDTAVDTATGGVDSVAGDGTVGTVVGAVDAVQSTEVLEVYDTSITVGQVVQAGLILG